MKSEERHELQQNDLETFLYYRLPHYLKQYGSYVLLVAALAFLGFQLWRIHVGKQQDHVAAAWAQFLDAKGKAVLAVTPHDPKTPVENPVDALNEVIQTYADVPLVAGKANLALGVYYKDLVVAGNPSIGSVTTSKEDALRLSQERFEKVLAEFSDQSDLVAEARMGLASLHETQRKFDEAQKIYESFVAKDSPYAGTTYAYQAARKLARLPEIKRESRFGPPGIWPRPTLTENATQTRPGVLPDTSLIGPPLEAPTATTASAPATTRAATLPK